MKQDPRPSPPTQRPTDEAIESVGEAASQGVAPRTLLGLSLLVVSTLMALATAWMWPDNIVLHFALVAQALPLLYALLAWWWARQPVEGRT